MCDEYQKKKLNKMDPKLIEKYATKTPEEMEKEQDTIEEDYMLQTKALEQKLIAVSSKIDPMKVGEEIFAYVKRPTSAQFERMTPPELAQYRKSPESIPYDVAKKYEEDMYTLLAELVVMPKHDAKWWRENTGDEVMKAFQEHLMNIRVEIQTSAESFLSPKKDTVK
jgi:hypothetical protein